MRLLCTYTLRYYSWKPFLILYLSALVEHVWNAVSHAQKPDLVFQRNGRVHLNWRRGGPVQSTTGSRGVRISCSNGSNAGYTMFWGRVQNYWLPIPLACFPFTSPTVRHRVPWGFNWALQHYESGIVFDLHVWNYFRFVPQRSFALESITVEYIYA